jgi:serine/threonine-protein kinase
VWDEAVKVKVKQALEGTRVPYALDTFVRVSAVLDGYAGEWVRQREDVCEAMGGQVAQPQSLAVRREYCLERRRSQLRALTELLSREPDKELVSKAVQMVHALSPVEYCADAQALMAAVPPPEAPEVRAQVEALQQQVDRLETLLVAGKYTEGLKLGEELLTQVESVGHSPMQAQVLYLMADLQEGAGDYKSAEERMRQALVLAARGKDLQLLARAWSHLAMVVGDRQGRIQEAEHLEPAGEVAVELAQDDRTRADWLNSLGNVLSVAGKYEEARERYEEALVLREKVLGPEHPDVAYSLDNLAQVLVLLNRNEEAKAMHERVLALREKVLGREHPYVGSSLNNLGNALLALGKYEEALGKYERALALFEQALGPEHHDSITALFNIGNVLGYLGRCEEAKEKDERALALFEQVLGPEHSRVASAFGIVGEALACLGRDEGAREKYERALALKKKALGAEHPRIAYALNRLGDALSGLGRYEEAKEKHEHALALQKKALGPEHPQVADSLEGLGRVSTELGRYEEAQARYEHALMLREKMQGPQHPELVRALLGLGRLHRVRGQPGEALPLLERALTLNAGALRVDVQFELAQALWMANRDRSRALQLATQVQEHWKRLGNQSRFTKVSRWLAVHASL